MKSVVAKLRCPKCGSTDIAEIIYQPVELTESLIEQIRTRRVVLRPAPAGAPRLKYYCYYCGYEW
ncbi:MAG: hypothetical protein LLF76_04485 [Planctomycetaceae bacterium]|nr:hypothetical protein [Planctomycetaceae bacterium]